MGPIQKLADFNFKFLLERGTHDLIAAIGGQLVTRRGIEVSGDMSIAPPIDVDLEGIPLIKPRLIVSNSPIEEVTIIQVRLVTQNGSFWDHTRPSVSTPSFSAAPNRVLLPSDIQTVTLYTQSGQSRRAIKRKFREGDSTAFMFPDRVDSVTLSQADGRPMATWAALPDHDRIRSEVNGRTVDPFTVTYQSMSLSRSFEETMGVSSLALDAAIPGFQPRWLIDVSKQYDHQWFAERDAGNDTLMSGAFIIVNNPVMPAGSPDYLPRDLHRLAPALHAP